MQWLGSLGATVAQLVVSFGVFAAAMFAGVKAWQKSDRALIGWVAGIGSLAVLVLVFAGSMRALRIEECKGVAQFDLCMNDD